MVSISRDYRRVLVYDPIPQSRHTLIDYLQSDDDGQASAILKPYLTSLYDDNLNGPYELKAQHLSMSMARSLLEIEAFKLPGAILLSLHASKLAGFASISSLLMESGLQNKVPIIALVGKHDLLHHTKLKRALDNVTDRNISRVIVWQKEDPRQDRKLGVRSMPSQIKMIIHRAMCADISKLVAMNGERHDNAKQMESVVAEGNTILGKSYTQGDATPSISEAIDMKQSVIGNIADDREEKVMPMSVWTARTQGKRASAFSQLLYSSAPKTSPLRIPRLERTKYLSLFRFDRAGKRQQKSAGRKEADTAKRWHRKHSLTGEDLKRFLKGSNEPQLSEKMQAKLKGITLKAKKSVKNKPVRAVVRDALQPDYMETPLPLQHTSKQDSLTHKALGTMRKGNFHSSVASFTDALVVDEFHFYARFYRGLCYATIGRFRAALSDMYKCAKIVAKMDPGKNFGPGCDQTERLRFVCYFNLALLHLNVHEHGQAVKSLDIAESACPDLPDAALLRGLVRRRKGLYLLCRRDYASGSKLKLRQEIGAVEASRIQHSFSTTKDLKHRHQFDSLIRSPVKKSQVLSFLTSVQKSLMTPCQDRTEMHLQYIAAMLTPHSFFHEIDQSLRMKLCQEIEYRTMEQGEWVFRRGDEPSGLYVCLSGKLNVMVTNPGMSTETHAGTLKRGDIFGEIGMMNKTVRTASIVVNEAAELCVIPAWLFEVIGMHAAMLKVHEVKRKAIIESKIFEGLPDHYIEEATKYATIRIYEQGEKLVEQGQHSENVFIILKGICEVWQRIDVRGELARRRKALLDESESLAKRYVYHHQLVYHTAGDGSDSGANGSTHLERKRERLVKELAQIDASIKELDRQKLSRFKKMSRWKRLMLENNSASDLSSEENKVRSVRLREIMVPSYFGDGSIRGDGAIEPADVVATTLVKAIRIFIPQTDFSKVKDSFLEKLENLSAVRPLVLEELTQRANGEAGWKRYKKQAMKFVGKSKWPLRGEAVVTEGAGGTSNVHSLPLPHGYLTGTYSI